MNLDAITRIAERKIQEAIDEGKFDDLPGKGQPLNLEEDMSIPFSVRMTNQVLKNANVLPEWIQIQKDIHAGKAALEALKSKLIKENQRWNSRLASLPEADASRQAYTAWYARSRALVLKHLKGVNTSILKFSLVCPSSSEGFRSYKVEEEMGNFDLTFPYGTPEINLTEANLPKEEAEIRQKARGRYDQGGGALQGWSKAASLLGFGKASKASEEDSCEDIKLEK